MTGQDHVATGRAFAGTAVGAVPDAPLAMPKQRLERAPSGLAVMVVRLLPAWFVRAPVPRATGR